MIAASYVAGIQSKGIATTIKHFACVFNLIAFENWNYYSTSFRTNDKENDRFGSSSNVTQRALREIYLMPFMLAEKYAKPWSFMTA